MIRPVGERPGGDSDAAPGSPDVEAEPGRPLRSASAAYARMYEAITAVGNAVDRLRAVLPEPGAEVDGTRSAEVRAAERDLLAAWVHYLHTYDGRYVS